MFIYFDKFGYIINDNNVQAGFAVPHSSLTLGLVGLGLGLGWGWVGLGWKCIVQTY